MTTGEGTANHGKEIVKNPAINLSALGPFFYEDNNFYSVNKLVSELTLRMQSYSQNGAKPEEKKQVESGRSFLYGLAKKIRDKQVTPVDAINEIVENSDLKAIDTKSGKLDLGVLTQKAYSSYTA